MLPAPYEFVPAATVTVRVSKVVSLIVTVLEVATIDPLALTVLTLAVNVSAPSVVASASGVTLNDPALLVITKLPVFAAKSPAFVTLQYSVVASSTFAVLTLDRR